MIGVDQKLRDELIVALAPAVAKRVWDLADRLGASAIDKITPAVAHDTVEIANAIIAERNSSDRRRA